MSVGNKCTRFQEPYLTVIIRKEAQRKALNKMVEVVKGPDDWLFQIIVRLSNIIMHCTVPYLRFDLRRMPTIIKLRCTVVYDI